MNYVESLMAEYGFSIHKAVWGCSLTAVFSLASARADRLGIDHPGFADRAAGQARQKAKSFFSENYAIK